MSAANVIAIHPIAVDITLKTTNLNLMLALGEESGNHRVSRITKCCANLSLKTLTCLWHYMKSPRLSESLGIMRIMNNYRVSLQSIQ